MWVVIKAEALTRATFQRLSKCKRASAYHRHGIASGRAGIPRKTSKNPNQKTQIDPRHPFFISAFLFD